MPEVSDEHHPEIPAVLTAARRTTDCPCSTCPYRARLKAAIAYYRTQRAEIARLSDLLARHERLTLHRYPQPTSQVLFGSQIWLENFMLRRQLARQQQTITSLHQQIAILKHFVRDYDENVILCERAEQQGRTILALETECIRGNETLQNVLQFYEGHGPDAKEVAR
jgi:hypothetical protein